MEVRQAALKCLIKVLEHSEPYDEVLDSFARRVENPSDLTNTVAGAVKYKLTLDYFIEQVSSRKIKKLSPVVKALLRLGIYELQYLKRSEYGVVNSYVELCKKFDKQSTSFLNAILRNFIRKKTDLLQQINDDLSIKYSHPKWMVDRWIRHYGFENTEKILSFNNKPPKTVLRVNSLKTNKDELLRLIDASESKHCEDCLVLMSGGNITAIPGYYEGLWVVQGESSAMVAPVLDPKPSEDILDLCAAPGSKTTHIASLMGDRGTIVAVDISPKRLKKISENCKRLGITCVESLVSDAAVIQVQKKFDRVLIDAPCSNTGVLGKRPDARWNKSPDDIQKLAELQLKILNNAAKALKSGGVMVYSTCSIEPEENEQVVEKFLLANNHFALESSRQILQCELDIDGFYIARFIN